MAGPLATGAQAPAFKLARDGGGTVELKDFKDKRLVLFFYPRAATPGCTKEAIAFSRLRAQFERAGTAVLGVSADPIPVQDRFKAKHQLALPLLSDETKTMLQAYGVWAKKQLYGRTFMGVVRTTYLIDGAGRVLRVWPLVKVDGHAEEVLAAARSL